MKGGVGFSRRGSLSAAVGSSSEWIIWGGEEFQEWDGFSGLGLTPFSACKAFGYVMVCERHDGKYQYCQVNSVIITKQRT